MNKAYLLIGGNMGDRQAYLQEAEKSIAQSCGTLLKASPIYETAAWGVEDQASFLNKALLLATELPAHQLLQTLLSIEESLGRKREKKFGPRIIDIDILLFNNDIISTPELVVPHPQLQHRRFALQCLVAIAAQEVHPLLHKTIQQLLTECTDPLEVHPFLI
jgi:2-amino-4-hydroxy-6-hydroxymethyldihydropteridine diphosphokinase